MNADASRSHVHHGVQHHFTTDRTLKYIKDLIRNKEN